MKYLFFVFLLTLSVQVTTQAQDVYICETVLFCNENGQCVEIEICDVVEVADDSFLRGDGLRMKGTFSSRGGALRLSGFPKQANGHTVMIKRRNKIMAPGKGKAMESLVGRSIVPGKYRIKKGLLDAKIEGGE